MIEAVKTWSEPQSVKDIQVFLSFINFYKRFIQNFNRIAALLISMLQNTNDEALSTQVTENEKNQDTPASAGNSVGVDKSIKNLSTVANLAKFKKTKSKTNFVKTNSRTDFFTPKAKEAFIHLYKAFTEAPILRHFDLEYYIRIKTNVSEYAISRILSQMTLDQYSSGYVTHEDPKFFKPKIGQ